MDDEDMSMHRVKFYGVYDLAAGLHADRVAELVQQFDPATPPSDTEDILELFNVQQYLENKTFPRSYDEAAKADAVAKIPKIKGAIGRHFSKINDSNFSQMVEGVNWQFLDDFIELLGRHKVFERCDAKIVLPALTDARIHVGQMLAHKNLVDAYDSDIADLLRSSPSNAELIIRKHLKKDSKNKTHTPHAFSTEQSRQLIENYIDSEDANPNFVRLVRDARIDSAIGLDAKLKLRAQRRHAEVTKKLFDENQGIKTGYGVGFSEDQEEPVLAEVDKTDGRSVNYTYGVAWLGQTLNQPDILNNFMHLFDFCDRQVLLTMPSYRAQMGTLEGLFGARGKDDYVVSGAFTMVDALTLMRVRGYTQYLESEEIYIENVIQWFFESYLSDEFGAENFSFAPSNQGASYLSRARHLFAEMESVANQFAMFATEGKLDRELLSISGDQVRFKMIGSLLSEKYAYLANSSPLIGIIFQLFSDQSQIHYISESLKARSAVELLAENQVTYENFHPHQTQVVDFLIANDVIENTGTRLQITNYALLNVLYSLHEKEAVSVQHLSAAGQNEIKKMVSKDWVTIESTLLTNPEAAYFNYFLNAFEFGNGPQLRNKYLHGTQAYGATENEHATAYTRGLRLLIALVIKMNDDFCLHAATADNPSTSS